MRILQGAWDTAVDGLSDKLGRKLSGAVALAHFKPIGRGKVRDTQREFSGAQWPPGGAIRSPPREGPTGTGGPKPDSRYTM